MRNFNPQLTLFLKRSNFKSGHYSEFASKNPPNGHFFSKIFDCTTETQFPLAMEKYSKRQRAIFKMNQRKHTILSRSGKPPVITDTQDYLRPSVHRTEKVRRKQGLISMTPKMKTREEREEKLKELLRKTGLTRDSKRRPLFKYNDKHAGYFHVYEYIEDPGIKKEKIVKNEKYFKRRYIF